MSIPARTLAIAFLATATLAAAQARGQSTNWHVSSGTWTTSANWDNGVPAASTSAFIQNGGTATISQPGATCGTLTLGSGGGSGTVLMTAGGLSVTLNEYVGNTGIGNFTQSGGTNTAFSLYLGLLSGSKGSYNLTTSGLLSVPAGLEAIGVVGSGSFTQSGGTNVVYQLNVASGGGSGAYNLGSNGLLSAANENIGVFGSGNFTQTGGANAVSSLLTLGNNPGGSGSYNLMGSQLTAPNEYVGDSGSGSFTQSGGTNAVTSTSTGLYLGNSAGGSGSYNLSGNGLLSIAFDETIGNSGSGSFTQSGGTNAVPNDALYFGKNAGSNGSYNLSGSGLLSAVLETVGNSGSGGFTQSGGTNAASSSLSLGNNVGGSGSYNLSGSGLLTTQLETIGYSGSGSFTQSGGTHSVATQLALGYALGSTGSYSLSGNGQLSAAVETIGDAGAGSFIQTGGTNSVLSPSLPFLIGASSAGGSYSLGGGLLSARTEYIGGSGSGSFTQTGGTHSVLSLYLGNGAGSSGSYNLSGNGLLTAAFDEFIGYSGIGSFTQSGGTNTLVNLTLGALPGCAYDLKGGVLSTWDLNQSGTAAVFNFAGGTFQAGAGFDTFVPIVLGPGSFERTFDTNGNTLTLYGGLSGPGDWQKIGAGLLVVSGTNTCSGNISVDAGTLQVSGIGVQLPGSQEIVGVFGPASLVLSNGTNSLSSSLYLGFNAFSSGNYTMAGGRLSATSEYIGDGGFGTFTQTGGINLVASGLYLGYLPGSSGKYYLQGDGLLSAVTEQFGNAVLQETSGTNTASFVNLRGGSCLLSSGLLQVNGGLATPGGILDGGGGSAAIVASSSSLVDLSGSIVNTAFTSLSIGADSLLIVAPGFDPTTFASVSNAGMLHISGTTLNVSAGTGFGGWGSIADPVVCQGSITATSGGWINLNNGLFLSDPGQVSLGSGTLTVNDTTFSGMTGGSLAASLFSVGNSGTGSFTHSGGSISLSALILGSYSGDSGTYLLSDGGQLTSATEFIALSGSGRFTQTGGTHSVGNLVLAQNSTSLGIFNLNGGLLSLSQLSQGGGKAAFNFAGGIFQAGAPFTIAYAPIVLTTSGSFAVFDTNGNALTLNGPLSGPGGLQVIGSGTLTLAVSNSYTGTTLVSNGTLTLGDPNALAGSTFDTSGSGSLNFGNLPSANFGGLQGSGGLTLTNVFAEDVALSVGGNNANTTFSGNLSDASSLGSLTKTGTGLLVMSGMNTYGGGTMINAGAVLFSSTNAIPNLDASSITINYGGAVAAVGAYPTVKAWLASNNIASASAGAIALTTASTDTDVDFTTGGGFNSLSLGAVGNVTYGGTIEPGNNGYFLGGGGGRLTWTSVLADVNGGPTPATINGPGTVVLVAGNSYSGGTTLNDGTLVVANSAGSATGSGPVTLNGGVLAASLTGGTISGPVQAGSGPHTIAPGAALSAGQYATLNLLGGLTTNNFSSLTFNMNPLPIASGIYGGDLINLGGSTLTVSSGSITFGVNPTAVGNYRLFADAGGSPVTDNFALPTLSGYSYVWTTADTGFLDLDILALPSGGTWTAAAGGSWTLGGNWSTSPTVPTGGTLTFPELGAVSTIAVMLDGPQSAETLVFDGSEGYALSQGTGGALTLGTSAAAPSISVLSGTHAISAPLVIAGGNLAIAESASSVLAISGNLSDDGNARSLTLTGDGSGLLILSGSNNYTGGTDVQGGTLEIDGVGGLPNGSALSVGGGASLLFVNSLQAAPLAGGVQSVPEPSTLGLFATTFVLAAGYRLRRLAPLLICRHVESKTDSITRRVRSSAAQTHQ